MFSRALALIVLGLSLTSCNDGGSDRLAEKARIEGQGAATAELEALNQRSKEMEADLAARQAFFQSVRGAFEGDLRTDVGAFKIRIILVPSVPPYRSERVRTLEEVAADLTGLSFSAQVVQWNPEVPLAAVGCRVDGIRPDLRTGEIHIASRECPNLYAIHLSSTEERITGIPTSSQASALIAEELRAGKRESVSAVVGQMYPSTSASVYSFHATRVQP